MAIQSKSSQSGAGDGEAAPRNNLNSFDFESHHSTTDAIVCTLSPSQTDRITQQFNHSLIAWVVGKDIRREQLAGRLRRHLCLTEDVEVSELGLGYFVLKFSETDFLALEGLPWSIPHLCICVSQWTPNFKPSEAINSSVDVWIRLHELSIEYYDDEIFQQIAEAIGGALVKIDPVTKDRRKCKYARICIRIDLCDPFPSTIKLGKIQQDIEYEGFDLLGPNCRRVVDLKHDCLNNPSGSSGFDPHGPHHHRARSSQANGSSSCSKQPLISSESSPASAWGSRFQVLEKDPLLELNLNDWPSLPMGECEKATTSTRTCSPQAPVKAEAVAKQKEKCGGSVQTLPNLPEQSSTITIKPPELKQTKLIQSVPLTPSVVEDQSRATNTSNPTTITIPVHNNRPQPSSLAASSPSLQPSDALEINLMFYSAGIQCSTKEKVITNTPYNEISVDSCPTVYTIDPKITSLEIALSEVRTTTLPNQNQNQYVIDFVPTSRGGDECGVGSEAVSVSESCSKKMLCWKFHEVENAKLMRALKDLIKQHEPSIVLIYGISGADADQVVQELAFCGSYCRKPDGYNGGVWLLLSRRDVQTEVSSYSTQQVSASVYFQSETNVPVLSLSDADTETTSAGPWGSTFFFTSTSSMNNTFVAY